VHHAQVVLLPHVYHAQQEIFYKVTVPALLVQLQLTVGSTLVLNVLPALKPQQEAISLYHQTVQLVVLTVLHALQPQLALPAQLDSIFHQTENGSCLNVTAAKSSNILIPGFALLSMIFYYLF